VRDGESGYVLVAGAHRLAAVKALGRNEIDCVVICDDEAELWEIDENLARAELDAAQRALLTKRRAEIIEARAAALLSQPGTPIKKRRGGRAGVAGKAAASVGDQAAKTGESKSQIARSMKRAEALGEETLRRVTGTSLGKNGAQLDALAKLDTEKREALIKQAEAGEKVSAVGALAAEEAQSTEPTGDEIQSVQSSKAGDDAAESEEENYCDLAEALDLARTPKEIADAIPTLVSIKLKKSSERWTSACVTSNRIASPVGEQNLDQLSSTLHAVYTPCGMPLRQVRIKCDCRPLAQDIASTRVPGDRPVACAVPKAV